MKFRYVLETVRKNGQKEAESQTFLSDDIVIGRGGVSAILLESKTVSLTHAKVSGNEQSIFIEDLGSLGGTWVNGKQISAKTPLHAKDKVRIGETTFEVFHNGRYFSFLESRVETDSPDTASQIDRQAASLSLAKRLPRMSVITLPICVLLLVVFFVWPYTGVSKGTWNSGPISNAHRFIESNCLACHSAPFVPAQDKDCLNCHQMSEHAPGILGLEEKHPELRFQCSKCHMEHNGDVGLIAPESSLCSECHGKLAEKLPDSGRPDISSFDTHAEYRVTIAEIGAGNDPPKWKRVSLADKSKLVDPTRIKLNHKLHLKKDLAGPDGPTKLECSSCHQLSNDLRTIVPVQFEKDCSSCHPLGFDDRIPEQQVPHGDPDVVFNYLYAEYSKLFLSGEIKPQDPEDSGFVRPGGKRSAPPKFAFTQDFVRTESRAAEDLLFTRTACFLCHETEEREVPEGEETDVKKSHYEILKPFVPERWMPGAQFDHGGHQLMSCQSCHRGAEKSEVTTDVLLPGVENCQSCHSQDGGNGKAKSECIVCHSFHDSVTMSSSQKRELEDLLVGYGSSDYREVTLGTKEP